MSKLSVDQKNIISLFGDKNSNFVIPDYQRPYAWTEEECQTLWEDIFEFAFPNGQYKDFNSDEEYYLGPIVTFKNENNKKEVIDGQQRLTTLMLLLRAFYVRFSLMKTDESMKTRDLIAKCIWKTDEFGTANLNELKIDSEVATDNDKEEFLDILKTGIVKDNQKSKYAKNYRFFQAKIEEFLNEYLDVFSYFPIRILNNCILLPIEADNQNTALRIFSTLNDRGLPLSDADIFKAQFYKYYSKKGEKENFIKKWKELEEVCSKIFKPISGTPMDELFTRYMYFERAKKGIKSSTTEALRKFYEKDSYALLNNDATLQNLIDLADFWNDVSNQDQDRFSERILKRLFVLNYAPNGMWTYLLSVYFMQNKDEDNNLDDDRLYEFLNKITAFIFAYAITNPGVNALRTPVFAEMINIVENKDVTFDEYKFEKELLKSIIENYGFWNQRPVTKSMLAWWAFNNEKQQLISLENIFEIEHIYAKKRQENEKTLSDDKLLDVLGNKAILEKRINIRASDYRFEDKKKYYKGFTNSRNQLKEGTLNEELIDLADNNKSDFTEEDIIKRNEEIINNFIKYLDDNKLIK
jgi:hypothetical protein